MDIYNLIVSSDDDDADAGIATVLDGIDDLRAWRIQHPDDSNERAVHLRTQHIWWFTYLFTHPLLSQVRHFSDDDDTIQNDIDGQTV